MSLDILCSAKFTKSESEKIAAGAASLGMSREEYIRAAVKFYAGQCVPTQKVARGRVK